MEGWITAIIGLVGVGLGHVLSGRSVDKQIEHENVKARREILLDRLERTYDVASRVAHGADMINVHTIGALSGYKSKEVLIDKIPTSELSMLVRFYSPQLVDGPLAALESDFRILSEVTGGLIAKLGRPDSQQPGQVAHAIKLAGNIRSLAEEIQNSVTSRVDIGPDQ